MTQQAQASLQNKYPPQSVFNIFLNEAYLQAILISIFSIYLSLNQQV